MHIILAFKERWEDTDLHVVRMVDGFSTTVVKALSDLPSDIRQILMGKIGLIVEIQAPWKAVQANAYLENKMIQNPEYIPTLDGEVPDVPEHIQKQEVRISLHVKHDTLPNACKTITPEESGLILDDVDTLAFWEWCENLPFE